MPNDPRSVVSPTLVEKLTGLADSIEKRIAPYDGGSIYMHDDEAALVRAAATRIRDLGEANAKLAKCLADTERLVVEHHDAVPPPDVGNICGVCHARNALRQFTANHAALSAHRRLAAHQESEVRDG